MEFQTILTNVFYGLGSVLGIIITFSVKYLIQVIIELKDSIVKLNLTVSGILQDNIYLKKELESIKDKVKEHEHILKNIELNCAKTHKER